MYFVSSYFDLLSPRFCCVYLFWRYFGGILARGEGLTVVARESSSGAEDVMTCRESWWEPSGYEKSELGVIILWINRDPSFCV